MNKFAINTTTDELKISQEFCKAENIGLEVTAFAYPDNLDGDIKPLIKTHQEGVSGISPLISHGPFFDLVVTSPDQAIIEVARCRHEEALSASIEIGASYYIAHTNFNALIRNSSYQKYWIEKMLEFWLPFADKAGQNNVVICLENLWEPRPDIQAELVSSGNHPNLRASFDNGHALVFSDKPSNIWIETLGLNLAHCHLHDNSGHVDEHKTIGEGKENWLGLVDAICNCSSQAVLVAECDNLELNKKSFEKLKHYFGEN